LRGVKAHSAGVNWRAWILSALAATASFDAAAECRAPPEADPAPAAESATGSTQTDSRGRMVAPVFINGAGPYRFIVDTGANRSAVSAGLAEQLSLEPRGIGEVHSIHGPAPAPLVEVTTLRYGQLTLSSGALPVLESAVLGSEHGLLGVDGMAGRRLTLDFERRCIEIEPSRGAPRTGRWAELQGELRFGHLVVVPGRINGVHVNVLIDTGSDTSLANVALRTALNARRERSGRTRALTANEPIILENSIFVRRIALGELRANNVSVFVGDYHIFGLWGLLDEPTLLLGMDVLSSARTISIDYGRGAVYFRL
jgi:predicted aspartyl protease